MKLFSSDLDRLRKMSDGDIDFSDVPVLDSRALRAMKLRPPKGGLALSIPTDLEVVAWFLGRGDAWASEADEALRDYIRSHSP